MIFVRNAPAKLNLTLDVLGKRPDGYHELRMVTQTIALADRVTLALTPAPYFSAICPGTDLPADDNNLAVKAARLFCEQSGVWKGGAVLVLHKRIPAGAGLGGGSADAAAVLSMANEGLGSPLSAAALSALAAQIGSDVPYCLQGGTKLVSGRGEIVQALPALPQMPVIVCKPDIFMSTAAVFSRLKLPLSAHPDTDGMINALTAGAANPARFAGNALEPVVAGAHPVIRDIRQTLQHFGAQGAAMTGTGSAVFGLFDSQQAAAAAFLTLRRTHRATFLTHTV